jgi:hypothetical protein
MVTHNLIGVVTENYSGNNTTISVLANNGNIVKTFISWKDFNTWLNKNDYSFKYNYVVNNNDTNNMRGRC